jgi:uncharacterized protein YjbI with pentapeptide repeats
MTDSERIDRIKHWLRVRMNDAADEPSKPTSAEPEFRKVSDEELKRILADHKRWVEAEDKTGLDHLRADLSLTDLRGQGAFLIGAQLQAARLMGTQLQGIYFILAQLQRANLTRAQLQRASLWQIPLQGATLSTAQLQEANLTGAHLQRAKLNGAQLQGAYLTGAHLREAILINANFERLSVTEGEKPGQERSADLTDADFRDADLSNAQLSTVTGLRAEMLGGAVLTNAKLPDDIKEFDKLTHAGETSKHAGTTFFALLAASLYSWLTIGTTTDVALITGAASSPLPIINTNIALSGFYWVAPLILLGVYLYLHLYLQRLWRDLSTLPAVFQDGEPLDEKAYPWLLNGLVRAHFARLKLSERPLSRLENLVSIGLAWWVVPLTLIFFWLRYLPRHDWWGTGLHVLLIAVAAWFGVYSYRLAVQTLSLGATTTEEENRGDQPLWGQTWRVGMVAVDALVAILVVLWADVAINPGQNPLRILQYETYAELTDDDVSTKPSGWTGRDETAAVEIAQVKGADLEGRDLRNADAREAFLVKAKLALADLSDAVLWNADLRSADLGRANLSGADLSGANLIGANLSDANVRKADLSRADLSDAHLSDTDLTGAKLSDANLRGADLSSANLGGSNLSNAVLRYADLSGATLHANLRNAALFAANLREANLRDADLNGANLNHAVLRGASLNRANLSGADLSSADLSGADLSDAELRDADLSGATLTDANLSDTDLRGADLLVAALRNGKLSGANLSGAFLHSADLSEADLREADLRGALHLTQAQLDRACGDDKTQLPQGLTIRTCPVTAPPASPSPPEANDR